MKKIVFLLIGLLGFNFFYGCTSPEKKTVVLEKETAKKDTVSVKEETKVSVIEMIEIDAPSLGNNILGDKEKKEIGISLPENYNKENNKYPVVYFLVGYNNTVEDFDNWADLKGIVNSMRKESKIKNMIFVAVDGQTKAGGSFYVNSPVMGNWENFITKDLVDYIDNNYRTIKDKNSRGLAGHSMGGFGAINIGIKNPQIFGYVYSMNPGLYDKNGLEKAWFYDENSINESISIVDKFNIEDEKLLKGRFKNLLNSAGFVTSYGMAFSYTDKMPYYELPYKKNDGKIEKDEEIIKRWENGFGNLEEKAALYKKNNLKLNGFVIDYGTKDEYSWIPEGCVYFENILKSEGIEHEMRPNDGGHGNLIKERMVEYMFPYFSEKLYFDVEK